MVLLYITVGRGKNVQIKKKKFVSILCQYSELQVRNDEQIESDSESVRA